MSENEKRVEIVFSEFLDTGYERLRKSGIFVRSSIDSDDDDRFHLSCVIFSHVIEDLQCHQSIKVECVRLSVGLIVFRRSNSDVRRSRISQISIFGEKTSSVDTRSQLMPRCYRPVVIRKTNAVIQMHEHRGLNLRGGQTQRNFTFVILRKIEDAIIAKDRRQVFHVTNCGGGEMSVFMFAMFVILRTAKTNGNSVNVTTTINR